MENKKPFYKTADPFVYAKINLVRKELMKHPTRAEGILWELLKNKKTGHKIRRQHVIDNYIVDFVCLSKRLIIEIDGEIHLQQKEKDELRTMDLNTLGYTVIRFTNNEVYESPENVAIKIKEALDRL